MRLLTCFVICLGAYNLCEGQHHFSVTETPIFRSADDSIAYTNSQRIFQQIIAGKITNLSADSILHQIRSMSERIIIGKRKKYFASNDFVSYDSLVTTIHDPNQITKLSIENRSDKRLPAKIFKYKNLESIELVNVPIRRLQKLHKLPGIKSIYVLNNRQLKPVKLSKSATINVFGTRGENPSSLPRSFDKFANLEKLDLADSKLSRFPTGIRENSKLTELLLSNNAITLEDGFMGTSASVEKIELQRNKIKSIPAAIGGFPNLRKLALNFNLIQTVADDISMLKKLEQLSFYNNRITAIPNGIYGLTNLKAIDLYFNQIERIDTAISRLTSLEVLYLSNNRLISVPESIGNLTHLTELYLSNNRLSDLPESLINLRNLRVLRVNNNYLSQLPEYLFKLNKLENIDISNNRITELPEEVADLSQLKLLLIINNPWDSHSKERLPGFTQKLRNREVVVHSD